ncbi:hypothetical protein ACWEK5_48195, partial [Rhodococcus koreensis]
MSVDSTCVDVLPGPRSQRSTAIDSTPASHSSSNPGTTDSATPARADCAGRVQLLESNKVSNNLGGGLVVGDVVAPDLEELRAFTARLRVVSASGDAGLGIDLLDAIETLKSVGCAVQAVITDDVAT